MIGVFSVSRRWLLILFFVVVSVQLLYVSSHRPSEVLMALSKKLIQRLLDENKQVSSSLYRYLIRKHGSDYIFRFLKLNKCNLYFKLMYEMEGTKWNLVFDRHSININDLPHDAGVFLKDRYINRLKENMINDKKNNHQDETVSEEEMKSLEHVYHQMLNHTIDTENLLVDIMTHFRVFDQCYFHLDDDDARPKTGPLMSDYDNRVVKVAKEVSELLNRKIDTFGNFISETVNSLIFEDAYEDLDDEYEKRSIDSMLEEHHSQCSQIEETLFPWLSKKLPLYLRWDGTQTREVPDLSKKKLSYQKPEVEKCFITNYKAQINGRGIVLSASDSHCNDLVPLLKILRLVGNTLPVQIIHKGDLSNDSMKILVDAARTELKGEKQILELMEQYKSSIDLVGTIDSNYSPIDLWFVDCSESVKEEYKQYFNAYLNKYLALLFNSFDEIVLMDTDSIPFVNPEVLFDFPQYQKSQTYFFKDRLASDTILPEDIQLFKKLLPTVYDDVIFQIPGATKKTLDQRLFVAPYYKHLMESGVMAYKRTSHYMGMFAAVQIRLWNSLLGEKIWGDKETYWLGMAMMGDEGFEFNENGAGALLTDNSSSSLKIKDVTTKLSGPLKTYQVKACSVQPAHIAGADNHTLLWINSGFKICKKERAYIDDINLIKYKKLFLGWTNADGHDIPEDKLEEGKAKLKKYYDEPLSIYGVLVPPPQENISKKRSARKGWRMVNECLGFKYCASDKVSVVGPDQVLKIAVATEDEQENTEMEKRLGGVKFGTKGITLVRSDVVDDGGLFVQYDRHRTLFYEFVGKVWQQTYNKFQAS